jgi:Fe-S oxidoreductase
MGRWLGCTTTGIRQRGRIDMTPESPKPSRVLFFGTCLIDSFYPEAGLAAIRLIEREGGRISPMPSSRNTKRLWPWEI